MATRIQKVTVSDIFRIEVDYGQSFERMVPVDSLVVRDRVITMKNFPIERRDGLVHFEARDFSWSQTVFSEEVKNTIESYEGSSLFLGRIEHLFSLGRENSDGQPRVCLGSTAIIDGKCHAPCMGKCFSRLIITSSPWEKKWGRSIHFLGVREVCQ